MNSEKFITFLSQIGRIQRPEPDWRYPNSPDYYDPHIEITDLVRPRVKCDFCPRFCSGRYSFRRSRAQGEWHVHCVACHRNFALPLQQQTPNK